LEQISGSGDSAQALYFLADQLGSTRALADTTGAIAATYTYNAYGATTATTGTATTPLRFAGQYLDVESNLYYLRARLYDPATAQFLTRDPLVPLTKQPYLYAGDNPLNGTDASGLWGLFDVAERAWDAAGSLAEGAASRASGLGRALAQSSDAFVRSEAGGLLRSAGTLAKNPALRVLRGVGAPIGFALSLGGALANGTNFWQAFAEATGSTAGGIVGALLGGLACAALAAVTAGVGLLACALLVGGLSFAFSWTGEKAGDWVYDFVTPARRSATYPTIKSQWGC
jgi:RHS repeat-associated protein